MEVSQAADLDNGFKTCHGAGWSVVAAPTWRWSDDDAGLRGVADAHPGKKCAVLGRPSR